MFDMESTLTYAAISVGALIALVIFFFVAKKVLRIALRLLVVAVFIVALLASGAWGWWNGWFGSEAKPQTARPTATPRRTPR